MIRTAFQSTSIGIDRNLPVMRLYEKAKRLGTWNPSDINLEQDVKDWSSLSQPEQNLILHLITLFQAGEEAVTIDILPLVMTIAAEGRLEEELYLTTFLFEEAKHTDFFNRFLNEVTGFSDSLERYLTDHYRSIFFISLPGALTALQKDSSPEAQVRAVATYNMIVEGVLAETGYHAFFSILEDRNIMPGTQNAIRLLKRDESRHIAYGIFLLSRLIAENDALWATLEEQMNLLLLPTIGVIGDLFTAHDPMPFGLVEEDFIVFASDQFNKRLKRVEKARNKTINQIYQAMQETIDTDTR